MRKLALAIALMALLLPAAAAADLNRASDIDVTANPLIQRYLGVAVAYWHETPAQAAHHSRCATYTVEVGPLESDDDEGEAPQPGCWQRISPLAWAELQEGEEETLRRGCVTTVHEFGHSTGHGHVQDPANVMYPVGPPLGSVAGCNAAFPLHEPLEQLLPPSTPARSARITGHAKGTMSISGDRAATMQLGTIPANADVESEIYIDGKLIEQEANGLIGWCHTRNVIVEAVARATRGPLLIRAFSFSGRHRIAVTVRWRS